MSSQPNQQTQKENVSPAETKDPPSQKFVVAEVTAADLRALTESSLINQNRRVAVQETFGSGATTTEPGTMLEESTLGNLLSEIRHVKTRLTAVEKENDNLKTQVISLKTRVASLEKSEGELRARVKELHHTLRKTEATESKVRSVASLLQKDNDRMRQDKK